MKAYIKSIDNEYPASHNQAAAMNGFKSFGFEICFYNDEKSIDYQQGDVVVGFVGDTLRFFKNNNIDINLVDFPKCFNEYYKRSIIKSFINEYTGDYPIFVKPVLTKLFKAKTVYSNVELEQLLKEYGNVECYFEGVVSIKAEWRVFVYYGKILGVYRYTDIYYPYDYNFIATLLETAYNMPNAYSIDIALTKEGDYLVIEVNDGWAIGRYGLNDDNYAKFLYARFAEIFDFVDILKEQ